MAKAPIEPRIRAPIDLEDDGVPLAIDPTAPVVQIVKATGLDVDQGGEFVRIKVETLTQGEVTLHIELTMATELIQMMTAARYHAEKFHAAAHGGVAPRSITNITSFAIGDIPQVPSGVMLVLNYDCPAEQMFLIPKAQTARDLARGLAQGADDATRRSKGILPAPGMNGHGRLLGPGGVPLA